MEFEHPRLARALGWFSLGLGLTQLAVPRQLSRAIGVGENPLLMRGLGLREIGTGVGLLARPRPVNWLWARVAGDVMDLALLGAAMRQQDTDRQKTLWASLAVAGVTALDAFAAMRLGRSLKEGVEAARRERGIPVEHSLAVNRSPAECYRFWRRFDNLPRFMKHVESIECEGNRSHWVVRAPGGTVEWDAEIVEDRPDDRIRWRSVEGSDVETYGWVRFEPGPQGRGCTVHVCLRYDPPGGALGAFFARLFGENPERQIREDMRHFKQVIETGEIPTTQGQPTGSRGLIGRTLAHGRHLS